MQSARTLMNALFNARLRSKSNFSFVRYKTLKVARESLVVKITNYFKKNPEF